MSQPFAYAMSKTIIAYRGRYECRQSKLLWKSCTNAGLSFAQISNREFSKNRISVKLMQRGVQREKTLCARVQGVQLPCAGQGRQPLPREVMLASLHTGYCLTLESAGLAAKLPFSQALLWEKMKRNAMSSAGRGDRHFSSEGHWKERGKIAIEWN